MAGDAELARGWQALGMSAWGEARAAIGLAQDLLTFQGQPAVATGWLQRARRVLADRPGSPQLFGTDVAPYPGVPGGPEVQHVALSAKTRAALHLALAGMVRDGVVDLEAAVRMGEGVLRGNAGRLYGLER